MLLGLDVVRQDAPITHHQEIQKAYHHGDIRAIRCIGVDPIDFSSPSETDTMISIHWIGLILSVQACNAFLSLPKNTHHRSIQTRTNLSSNGREDIYAAVHRKEYEMRQVKAQHKSTSDPVRMAMSYAQESVSPMTLAKALRRIYEDPQNPAHPDYQEPTEAESKRSKQLQDIGMAELGMRRGSFIVDIKRQSPRGGRYCSFDDAGMVAAAMVRLGADAVLVNTDFAGYGGDISELKSAVKAVRQVSKTAAVVMKDIVVDEIQLGLAKEAGCDGILLMSSVLGPALENFMNLATTIGLETIVECHTRNEVERAIDIMAPNILVNNYDRVGQKMYPEQAIQLAVGRAVGDCASIIHTL